jgi:hypothetical protein
MHLLTDSLTHLFTYSFTYQEGRKVGRKSLGRWPGRRICYLSLIHFGSFHFRSVQFSRKDEVGNATMRAMDGLVRGGGAADEDATWWRAMATEALLSGFLEDCLWV